MKAKTDNKESYLKSLYYPVKLQLTGQLDGSSSGGLNLKKVNVLRGQTGGRVSHVITVRLLQLRHRPTVSTGVYQGCHSRLQEPPEVSALDFNTG